MIELSAISLREGSRPPSSVAAAPLTSAHALPPFQKELRLRNVSLTVTGDEPVERYVFESPECSLICRADLLEDTPVSSHPAAHIANLYEREGDSFPTQLRGAFSIILYDHRTRTLKGWIDHFGIEKLIYAESADGVCLATDLRLVIWGLRLSAEIDTAAVQQYLQYSCIPTPRTIYKGISKLAPGHGVFCASRPVTRAYWDMAYSADTNSGREEASWAEETFQQVRKAVGITMRGLPEADFGCFLSGGTDSSSITGLVGQLTGKPPKSFSIGFDDPRYNEIHYARVAAEKYRAEHREYFVKPADILDLIQRAVPVYDEPFGNSSIIPTYYCARLARENGVAFLLAGDGGDELFGGNSRYVDDRVFQRYNAVPRLIKRALIEPTVAAGSLTKLRFFDRAARYIRRANIPQADRIFSYALISSVSPTDLFTADFISASGSEHPLTPARTHFSAARAQSDLNRWLYLDLKIIITDNDLRKVSSMSKLAGITTRYPLLEPGLAEFTGTIPDSLKVKGNQLRYLFKKAMARILPPEIISKSKHGFGLPYSVWVGEYKPLRDFTFDVLGSKRCRERGYFRPDLLDWLWRQYETVHRPYYGEVLWVFLMLELWHTLQHDFRGKHDLVPAAGRMG
jgi:asparagine synthase (glutamine-hydrolysing)